MSSASAPCVSSDAPSVHGPSACPCYSPSTEDVEAAPGSEPGWLLAKMMETTPPQDQKWISAALRKHWWLRADLKLWYEPPEPALIYHQAPTHRLLLWMPYHLGKVRLSCPVCGKQLTGYGAQCGQILPDDNRDSQVQLSCKTSYIHTSSTSCPF